MGLRLTVGGVDYTNEAQNVTWSNVDPGGYELFAAAINSPRADRISVGDRIVLQDGTQTVWEGRVAEPDKSIKHMLSINRRFGAAQLQINGEGYGSGLKDNLMSMVYIDRDVSRWGSWSATRQLALAATWNTASFSWQATPDTVNGIPSLLVLAAGAIGGKPLAETWYDAGPTNKVSRIRINSGAAEGFGFPDANNSLIVFAAADDSQGGVLISSNFAAAAPSVDFSPSSALRYAGITFLYNLAAALNVAGANYGYSLRNISVIGNHGLTLRGTAPADGFYTGDIVADAVQRAIAAGAFLRIGRIDPITNYIVQHYVQYGDPPVDHETVVADMARLSGATWGVWESSDPFSGTPEFSYRAYPTDPTVFLSLADCDEIDVSERLANMYTQATITWTDAAGVSGLTTVSLPNAYLDRVGIKRTITLDLGTSSAAAAGTFASFVLQILYAQARAAGSLTVPRFVRSRSGGLVKASWLKAGIDRARVSDLSHTVGLLQGSDLDSYRISRVENVLQSGGDVQTRVEIDAGPNLLETLQARLSASTQIAGG